jgi:hypothetical protein
MLGPLVTGITLVYAEKVKFIAFTLPLSLRLSLPLSLREGTGTLHSALFR